MNLPMFQADASWLPLALTATGITPWVRDVASGTVSFAAGAALLPSQQTEQVSAPIDAVWALIHPADRPTAEQLVQEALATGGSFRQQLRVGGAGGTLRWFDVFGSAQPAPTRVVGVAREISAERQLQASAQAAQQVASEALARLDAIFVSAPTAIAYLDCELRYMLVNPAFAELTGVPSDEHFGRRLSGDRHRQGRLRATLSALYAARRAALAAVRWGGPGASAGVPVGGDARRRHWLCEQPRPWQPLHGQPALERPR